MPLNNQQTIPRDNHTPSTLSTASRPQSPLYDSSRSPSPRARSRSRTPLRRSRSVQPPRPPRLRYSHTYSYSRSTHPPLHSPPYPASTPSSPPPPPAQTSRSKHLSSSSKTLATTGDDQHRQRRRQDRRRSSSAHSSGSLTRGEKLKSSLAFLGTVAAATYLIHKVRPTVLGDKKELKGLKGKEKEVVGRGDGERNRERDRDRGRGRDRGRDGDRDGGRCRDRDGSVIRDVVVEERFRNGRPQGRRVYDDGRLILDERRYRVRGRRSVDGRLDHPRHRRYEVDDDYVAYESGW
ncbi:hypothetical protein DL764_000472 [Monosporascus ibericus]|uniref:Uncharacterized protein n=1 Tax=Monosporascus ibericus TaxID=155417 RepID=A0A4Q4TUY7_9PEZI|nr:hypothetical protein DL764_000472 [Monosporascus ibericus]